MASTYYKVSNRVARFASLERAMQVAQSDANEQRRNVAIHLIDECLPTWKRAKEVAQVYPQASEQPAIQVLSRDYDAVTNKTHIKVDTPEFTEWFWVSGMHSPAEALALVRPVIERKLAELAA